MQVPDYNVPRHEIDLRQTDLGGTLTRLEPRLRGALFNTQLCVTLSSPLDRSRCLLLVILSRRRPWCHKIRPTPQPSPAHSYSFTPASSRLLWTPTSRPQPPSCSTRTPSRRLLHCKQPYRRSPMFSPCQHYLCTLMRFSSPSACTPSSPTSSRPSSPPACSPTSIPSSPSAPRLAGMCTSSRSCRAA